MKDDLFKFKPIKPVFEPIKSDRFKTPNFINHDVRIDDRNLCPFCQGKPFRPCPMCGGK